MAEPTWRLSQTFSRILKEVRKSISQKPLNRASDDLLAGGTESA